MTLCRRAIRSEQIGGPHTYIMIRLSTVYMCSLCSLTDQKLNLLSKTQILFIFMTLTPERTGKARPIMYSHPAQPLTKLRLILCLSNTSSGIWAVILWFINITLVPPTATTQAVVGNFSEAKQQEINVSYGTRWSLCPDVHTKLQQETYGRSGTRRIVSGQFFATDPKGRSWS